MFSLLRTSWVALGAVIQCASILPKFCNDDDCTLGYVTAIVFGQRFRTRIETDVAASRLSHSVRYPWVDAASGWCWRCISPAQYAQLERHVGAQRRRVLTASRAPIA